MLKKNCLCSIMFNDSFYKVVKNTKRALQEAGFEVIYEINLSELIENRLGIKINKYLILEILNPYTAFQFILTELQAGLFIPFRIVILEDNEENITVSALNPEEAASLADNEILKLMAGEASEKLINTFASLQNPIQL